MSKFEKCKACKGTGFKDNYRTIICPVCTGSALSSKRQRGHHGGHDTNRRESIGKNICPSGHLKTGVSIDDNGDLRPYCETCHRELARNTARKKKESLV